MEYKDDIIAILKRYVKKQIFLLVKHYLSEIGPFTRYNCYV